MFGRKKQDLYGALFSSPLAPITIKENTPPTVAISELPAAPVRFGFHDGNKFPGGFGATEFLLPDYWTLRQRSAQLFQTNLYARGLIRRLVTNEINTGLHLEATPEEAILGKPEDSLAEWSEDVENRFHLWEMEATLCDHSEQLTFGALQAAARQEALISGDVLVVLRQDQRTGLPRVQLINGASVQTPFPRPNRPGVRIVDGVEIDSLRRHVAYWIRQEDGTAKRLPAYGEKSGRRIAWLVYGTDKRLDEVRGTPLLSIVLQSLREIDRYRDSTQRKALINSMIAVWIKKTQDGPSRPSITGGGAMRKGTITSDASGAPRTYRIAEHIPGLVLDELSPGDEAHPFSTNGTDENFGAFEAAVIQAVAWINEIPPEILMLSFSSNYSASQAAINEFKMYLHKQRTWWGQSFCQPIYDDWLLSAALSQKIQAPGFLDAWRDPAQHDIVGAWKSADWAGHIKPAVDLVKLVTGYKEMVTEGFITRDRACRELTGMKFSKCAAKLARENKQIMEANRVLAELKAAEKPSPSPPPSRDSDDEDDAQEKPAAPRKTG